MSTTRATAVSPGAATADQPAADPEASQIAIEDIAKQITDGLAALARLIPTFVPKHNENEAFVRRFRAFSVESIRSMIAAIEAYPELNSANKLDVPQARADLQFLDAFRTVIDAVEEFRTNVRFTYSTRKARAVNRCCRRTPSARESAATPPVPVWPHIWRTSNATFAERAKKGDPCEKAAAGTTDPAATTDPAPTVKQRRGRVSGAAAPRTRDPKAVQETIATYSSSTPFRSCPRAPYKRLPRARNAWLRCVCIDERRPASRLKGSPYCCLTTESAISRNPKE